jgi:flavodoxin
MKKVLVVYYSRTGNTEKAALELAKTLNADTEKLVDMRNREGIWGYIISGRDASMKKLTSISPVKYKPENYDLVILATPTWASSAVPAIRTYVHQHKDKIKNTAFLVTQGGGCNGKVYDAIKEMTGLQPKGTIDVGGREFKNGSWLNKIKDFAQKVNA